MLPTQSLAAHVVVAKALTALLRCKADATSCLPRSAAAEVGSSSAAPALKRSAPHRAPGQQKAAPAPKVRVKMSPEETGIL